MATAFRWRSLILSSVDGTQHVRRAFEDVENPEWSVYPLGISGDTTTSLLKRMAVETEARKPDALLIQIGVNDARYIETEDHPETPLPVFKENIEKIMQIAKQHTEGIAFLGITPVNESKTMPIPWRPDLYYTERNVAQYAAALEMFCSEQNIRFIPMGDIFTKEDLPDGLHPSVEGHTKIAERVLEHLPFSEST